MGGSLRLAFAFGRRVGRGVVLLVAAWALLPRPEAAAEIFRWRDAQGRLHFSEDLNQVPPQHRAAAAAAANGQGSGREIQRYESAPAAPRPGRANRSRSASQQAEGGPVHRVRVQKTGSSMRANVRLNDRVVAPFILDTGASDVSIPEWVARELGLELDGARTRLYRTANGIVENAVVTLESVDLGGARVENVPASVSRSMSVGLLGLSFFNHFRYRIDPAAGVVTLRPNGLAEEGRLRAGRSRAQWRNEFAQLHARREAIEAALGESGSHRARRREQLREALEEAERQLAILESEADDARVPMQWRD
ncbi:MAG: TIGR02281 family clan AA aspartic protease [Deltaproteobacteria bacterium]|jgi:aspartyl protease family protein|nr:TIGR02281 family clan AA aspartic protease [Deltaproteobacteria bacterium]MBW2498956.1 TIGR02281 family clan AA aspartic protease [Deltaproteobacteria bacterium]